MGWLADLLRGCLRPLRLIFHAIAHWWYGQRTRNGLAYRIWAAVMAKIMAPLRLTATVVAWALAVKLRLLRAAAGVTAANKLTAGIVAVGVALIGLLLAGGGSEPAPVAAGEIDRPDYVVGAVVSLTGKLGREGSEMHRGYAAAAALLNAAGGVDVDGVPHDLKLVVYDDESSPVRAREVVRLLLDKHAPQAVLAPYSSRLAEAMLEVAQDREVPVIVPVASAEGLASARRGVFQLQTPPQRHLRDAAALYLDYVAAARADEQTPAKKRFANGAQPRVLLAAAADPHSQAVLAGVREALAADADIEVVEFDIGMSEEEYGEAKKALAKTDALFLSGYAPGAIRLMETIAADSVNIPYIAMTHCSQANINRHYPTVAEGALCALHWQPEAGFGGVTPLGADEFLTFFYERYGAVPTHRSAAAAAAVDLLRHG
ncbi:MAG: ABC transporter substrate-binding protein, partial [Betaproteobacteria bacterium AqS2]|nr:ABC transporter substrate-binding protein [Betaproteobacteria bacterium AqS2]